MPNVYRFLADVFHGREVYIIYSSSGVNQGDMMQWDTGARVAVAMTTTSGAIFLGVTEDANPLASLGTSSVPLTGARARIISQGIHQFKTTSGETYSHLDPVYMGADAQTVTQVSAGRLIGRVHLPNGNQVTGGTGTSVNVRIFGSMTNDGRGPSSATGDR